MAARPPAAKTEIIATEIWRPPAFPATEFARIAYRGFHFEPHFHQHYVIMLVERGINLGRRVKDNYDASPGEMLVIQPGEVHTGSAFEDRTLRYLAFYPDAVSVARWLERLEVRPASPSGFGLKYRSPVLTRSFRRLFRAASAHVDEPLERDGALLEFFAALLAAQPGGAAIPEQMCADPRTFQQAVAFIRDHYDQPFALDDLAAAGGTSPFHLIRLFRRHSGLTPFAYLRSFRVERSKEFIRSGKSLTEVALAAGFYDQSHFIRSFKQHTGFLPSRFRNPRRSAKPRGATRYNSPPQPRLHSGSSVDPVSDGAGLLPRPERFRS